MSEIITPAAPNGKEVIASMPPITVQKDNKEELELLKSDRPVELFRSYDQGMMDGLLENNTAYFEQFIDAFHFREFKNKSIYFLRGQLKELLDKQAKAKEKVDTLVSEKCQKEAEREAYTFRLDYVQKIIAYWREKLAEAKESSVAIKESKGDYGLFAALIFFLFALLFIAADYTICLTIVADTLKIGLVNGKPTLPSHLFALAMSGLAVVLKPAYDRLVEKPYHRHQKKKTFTVVIILLSLLILGMLFTLGVFREEIVSSGLMDAQTGPQVLDPISGQPIGSAASGSANPLDHTWARKAGVISSTVLFAIAGAVCLGIALPIFHQNFRNYWNRFRRRSWHRKEHQLLKEVSEVESKRAAVVLQIKVLDDQIIEMLKEVHVEEAIAEKKSLIQIYQHGEMVKNIAKSTSLYLAGYDRGQKLIGKVPQEWLFDNVYASNPGIEKPGEPTVLQGKSVRQEGPVGKRTRPFVALRRMISHNFKKKWNQENDINIEYYNFD